MAEPIFYAPPDAISDDCITLDEQESRHASTVMRLRGGSSVIVVDGLGTAYRGAIEKSGRKKTVVRTHATIRNFGEPDAVVTLAAGLSVGTKFDTVVEKATELGVKRIVPLLCEKGTVKATDESRARARRTRLEKVALAAMKQCRRSYRPEISLPLTFDEFVKAVDPDQYRLIFHPDRNQTSISSLFAEESAKRIAIIVGPESGFSDDEVDLAISHGVKPVSLGQRILRTETAAPTVLALVMHRIGELS